MPACSSIRLHAYHDDVRQDGDGIDISARRRCAPGVPQVVIAQQYDQHYWAQRIHDLGIGTAHLGGSPTNDSLMSALEHALQPGVAARARSTATAVRSDGAQVAARRLLTSR
jgi:vancomycin aglycone glucosyltransferase